MGADETSDREQASGCTAELTPCPSPLMRLHAAPVIRSKDNHDRSLRSERFAPSLAGPREHHMDDLTPSSLIHFYDTRSHEIACGLRGFDQRSTKHPRQVTCHACVALIGERPSHAAAAGSEPSADAAP